MVTGGTKRRSDAACAVGPCGAGAVAARDGPGMRGFHCSKRALAESGMVLAGLDG